MGQTLCLGSSGAIAAGAAAEEDVPRASGNTKLERRHGDDKGPDIMDLCFAASKGNVDSVNQLLRARVEVTAVDYDRRSALHIASADGHLDVVQVLIEAKADVNAKDRWGHTALDEANNAGFVNVRASLVEAGATIELPRMAKTGTGGALSLSPTGAATVEVGVEPSTAMCCAAAAGSLELLQDLVSRSVDLNSADYDGRTALHVASAHGHTELVRWLTTMRANVNLQDSFGLTALSDAKRHGNHDAAKILATEGAWSADLPEVILSAAGTGAWAIPLSEVVLGSVLSKTLKSVIYRATWRGTQVVCKTTVPVNANGSETPGQFAKALQAAAAGDEDLASAQEELIREIKLLSTLRHPDLVMFLGACVEHSPPLVLTEFMEGGDLERYYRAQAEKLGRPYKPPTSKLLTWASAVARALAFLHGCSRPIVHRDLKPLNLLLTRGEELKVTDFGISKLMAPKLPGTESGSPISAPMLMSGGVGTWRYMAPEVVRYEQYTDRVDIYSYALICWFMCTGRQPFVEQFGHDAEVVLKEYLAGREPRPDASAMKCPESFRKLTQDCWHVKPDNRPSAIDCTQRLAETVASQKEGALRTSLRNTFGRQVSNH